MGRVVGIQGLMGEGWVGVSGGLGWVGRVDGVKGVGR